MTLLQQIQEAITQEESDLGSILLKLRLLAARLNSDILGDWVRYESEGYPKDVDVPQYRIVGVSYRGIFLGPLGSGIYNAQIPPHLIEKHADKRRRIRIAEIHPVHRVGIVGVDIIMGCRRCMRVLLCHCG